MGTLKGQLYVDGKRLPDAIVSFFDKKGGPPPVVGSTRRVPDMVGRTDAKGQFTVQLLPGTYYMGAMIRKRGKGPGPPRKGEKFYFIRDNKGNLRAMEVKSKAVTDAGRVNGVVPGKFKEFKNFITISGIVVDQAGKPEAGILVTLKDNIKAHRPKYITHRTGNDGKFFMRVPPGRYFVVARESLREGRPKAGSMVGTYGKSAPIAGPLPVNAEGGRSGGVPAGIGLQGGAGKAVAVEGKSGQVISGIKINMFKIPDPQETRREFEKKARASDMAKKKAAGAVKGN